MADGFLGRWAKRKQEARAGQTLDEPPREPVLAPAPAAASPTAAPTAATAQQSSAPAPTGQPAPAEATPPPTLEDARQLTPQSDFKPFVARDVAPEVRNAAMKKLFSDPHFNVMDGLDIYIDDYSIPSPLPTSMMRRMVGAQMLNLFDEEAKPAATPSLPATPSVPIADAAAAASGVANAAPTEEPARLDTAQSAPMPPLAAPTAPTASPISQDSHADPDLRLQPDHAPGAQGSGHSAG